VLWQHVFQFVVCVLSAVQRATQSEKCNFSKAQRNLPEDGPDGPKHIGANIDIL
jgi:hypothetical protein